MDIFRDTKTIVGLFDNAKAIERAMALLQQHGFDQENGDEIHLIDQHHLAQEKHLDIPAEGGLIRARAGIVETEPEIYGPLNDAGTEAATIERRAKRALTDRGMDSEEATFFARPVARGTALVVVKTTSERAAEAFKLVEEASTQAAMLE